MSLSPTSERPSSSVKPTGKTVPNFAVSTSNVDFFYNGSTVTGQLTNAEAVSLVQGNGIATAIANAAATFNQDGNFSSLFTLSGVRGEEGAYNSIARSEAQVIGAFSLKAYEKFAFAFEAADDQSSKEIENRDREYAFAGQSTSFVVLDITNPDRAKVIDYFGMNSQLDSGNKRGVQRLSRSQNVKLSSDQKVQNIDGNDGIDFQARLIEGNYQRSFNQDTRLAVVEVTNSYAEVIGDTFIGNLGRNVTYGTIRNDTLYAPEYGGRVYASYGNDLLVGRDRNDILEGSFGNDNLQGKGGNDKLHGGFDNDRLDGGRGSDTLVGGQGKDTFVFTSSDFRARERDVIADFEPGVDRLEFSGWNSRDIQKVASINSSQQGATLKFYWGGEIVFQGLTTDQLRRELVRSQGASASFEPDQDTLLRQGTRTEIVGVESVNNFKQSQGVSPATNLVFGTQVEGGTKLSGSTSAIRLEGDKIQFKGDVNDYTLQFVQGVATKPNGTSINYQGSGDLDANIQGSVGGDTFGTQVFATP